VTNNLTCYAYLLNQTGDSISIGRALKEARAAWNGMVARQKEKDCLRQEREEARKRREMALEATPVLLRDGVVTFARCGP
jgi:hypothetical protein